MILVAGGSGRLGAKVVARLAAGGAKVRVLSRRAEAPRERLGSGVEVVEGDVRDASTLPAALAGVDLVISAVTGFGPGGDGVAAVDERGNANLIGAAEKAGVRRFVLVSTEWASADHPMELMRRKHAAEQRLLAAGMEWAIVRPTAVADLWIDLLGQAILKGAAVPIFGRGDNPISFAASLDVAEVVVRCVEDPGLAGATLAVGGPSSVSMRELAALVGRAVGREPKLRSVPLVVLRLGRLLLRPVRSDIAGLLEGGLFMATGDLSFEPDRLTERIPDLRLTPIREVVEQWASIQHVPAVAPV